MGGKKRRIGARSGFVGGALAVALLVFLLGRGFGLGPGSGPGTGQETDSNGGSGPGQGTAKVYELTLVGNEIRHRNRVLTLDAFEALARRARDERAALLFRPGDEVRGLFVERIQAILKRVRVRHHGLE